MPIPSLNGSVDPRICTPTANENNYAKEKGFRGQPETFLTYVNQEP